MKSKYLKLEVQIHKGGCVLADPKGNIIGVGGPVAIGEAVQELVRKKQADLSEVTEPEA